MKTILLKFSGPLQSWGTDSCFESRHTDFYPSKSAVIGMIAASFGYKRTETENLLRLNELDFGVRIDQPGKLCRDYHIARKYKKTGEEERTYVTNRYYLEDAVFVVAISHSDDSFIEEILYALRHPWFQTSMGRRALPIPADAILDIFQGGVVEQLEKYEWQAASWYKDKNKGDNEDELIALELVADAGLVSSRMSSLRKDKVYSFSQEDRKFGFRYESAIKVMVPKN